VCVPTAESRTYSVNIVFTLSCKLCSDFHCPSVNISGGVLSVDTHLSVMLRKVKQIISLKSPSTSFIS
jgi:hypothetical protein